MADDPQDAAKLNLEVRQDLSDAYAFLVGKQSVATFESLTPEELMQQQIDRISGKRTDNRPNELERLSGLTATMAKAIDRVKSLPADAFKDPDPQKDVNSPPDDEDPVARQKRITGM